MINSYKTSTIDNKSFMQAHHGIQSKTAKKLFGNYYNKKDAPVILLRDSCRGTPHYAITNLQIGRKSRSYFEERTFLEKDLKRLNVTSDVQNKFLLETDKYFYSIYKDMISDGIPLQEINRKFKFDFINKKQIGD